VAIQTANPSQVSAWQASAAKGGAWAPGGIAGDGNYLYVGTGNTEGATTWSGGDGILRLQPGAVFGGTNQDFFAPSNWQDLDEADKDMGSAGPVLFDHYALAMGKSGIAYLLDLQNMGGVGTAPAQFQAARSVIISAPVTYLASPGSTPGNTAGRYVAFKAVQPICGGTASGGADLMALKLSPQNQFSFGWCAIQNGRGSPIVTTTDGTSNSIVWSLGAEGDNELHAFDGESGASLFSSVPLGNIRRFQTPIEANGIIYVATDAGIAAFQAQ
jgi:hypothetical protein